MCSRIFLILSFKGMLLKLTQAMIFDSTNSVDYMYTFAWLPFTWLSIKWPGSISMSPKTVILSSYTVHIKILKNLSHLNSQISFLWCHNWWCHKMGFLVIPSTNPNNEELETINLRNSKIQLWRSQPVLGTFHAYLRKYR